MLLNLSADLGQVLSATGGIFLCPCVPLLIDKAGYTEEQDHNAALVLIAFKCNLNEFIIYTIKDYRNFNGKTVKCYGKNLLTTSHVIIYSEEKKENKN